MYDSAYQQLAAVEDRLWWHESRRALIRMMLRDVRLPSEVAALDVGCGTGGSLSLLSEYATRVVGLDLSPRALGIARRKHPAADLHQGNANSLAQYFSQETFHLITLLNVLYHEWIDDELAVLRQAYGLLKPGGVILVTEPAHKSLFRRHDRIDMGKHRYNLTTVRRFLEQAGFEWIRGTYFNGISLAPAWALARWERIRPDNNTEGTLGELRIPPFPINAGMRFIMACERTVIRILGRLPVGVTVLGLARKPEQAIAKTSSCVALA